MASRTTVSQTGVDVVSLEGLEIRDAHLAAVLRGEAFLVQDGAMGTQLQQRGLTADGQLPDLLNLSHPNNITAIHAAYVQAGAQMVTANTFSANAYKLEGRAQVDDIYRAAAENARAAGARYVAADIGPIGALLEPMGTLSFDEAYQLFAEQVQAAVKARCDILAIETMSDMREAKAAVLAAKEHSNLPVFVSMTFGRDGRTFLGTPPEVAALTLSSLGAHVVGVNCSLGPVELEPLVATLLDYARCPVVVRPNAGLPRVEEGHTVYDVDVDEYTQAMARMMDAGVSVVGGCCGTSPAFIQQLRALVDERATPVPRADVMPHAALTSCASTASKRPGGFAIASAQHVVSLPAGKPHLAVIGERINPTGKPRLKQALREGNWDYVVGEAVAQQQAGADVLDVNVGLPELDEPTALSAVVRTLEATISLPLVIDSSDPLALEAAVRPYAGKPLINSVNGKQENLEAVLPLVKKYGCAVIGLTLDEAGIPSTAEERFAIAQRIVQTAQSYGIPAEDVVIDCLVMAAATNQEEVREILRAVSMVKERLGVRTALGVSNVSFGLPQRGLVNATFLAAALGAGLDMPILNPLSGRYQDAVAAFKVLNGQDTGAATFIEAYAQASDPYTDASHNHAVSSAPGSAQEQAAPQTPASTEETATSLAPGASPAQAGNQAAPVSLPPAFADAAEQVQTLVNLILTGRKGPIAQVTTQLLENHRALDIIDQLFIPTLDEVGARFERGEFFLPQLMASAEAVKAGFDVVKTHMASDEYAATHETADTQAASGYNNRTILVATVKGDIHDIGKNIVKMLLENYGFNVVDLGRDVSPQDIVREAKQRNITLVGLSALMTTTVKAMAETIELLHQQAPGVKVFVGGAVLTDEYATQIGADFYGKDAAAAARIAETYFATHNAQAN